MKERLDIILVQKGLAESRDKAKRTIMAGLVTVDGIIADKPGQKYDDEKDFFVKEKLCKYVSRGGLKLEKAISSFDISLKNLTCMDMGASTGGFTDCMLQNGASKVYAIDVGYGQLDYKLRIDKRVVNIEKTNIRYLDTSIIEDTIDFISIDVSFISLNLMFPVVKEVLSDDGHVVALIKPQFEAGREQVGKHGIVRDTRVHKEVISNVIKYASNSGLEVINLDFSPVKGTKGNIEYLAYLRKSSEETDITDKEKLYKDMIDNVVLRAHSNLDNKEEKG